MGGIEGFSQQQGGEGGRESAPWTTKLLLAAARQGDVLAETRLFAAHRLRLLDEARRSMRSLRAHMAPEDVVDEVFVRALGSGYLRRFEPHGKGSLRAALGQILRHVIADCHRRYRAEKRRLPSTSPGRPSAVRVDPNDVAAAMPHPSESLRVAELVAMCRQVLTPREWQAWDLVEIQELTSTEAAGVLGASASAVRGLVARAREKLVDHLSRMRSPRG